MKWIWINWSNKLFDYHQSLVQDLDVKIKKYYQDMGISKDKKKNHVLWLYIQDLKKQKINHYAQMDALRKKILYVQKSALKKVTNIREAENKLYNVDNFDRVRSIKSWLLRFFINYIIYFYKENMKKCVDIYIVWYYYTF